MPKACIIPHFTKLKNLHALKIQTFPANQKPTTPLI
eukprot:UN12509